MDRKIIIAAAFVMGVILGAAMLYANEDYSNDVNRTTLNVSSEGPIMLSDLIHEIRTEEYYSGYDEKTVEWMESLGNKYVWLSADEIVIMDNWDSDKIPSAYACDAYFREIFSCNVLENRSFGSGDRFNDVLLVDNVEYITEEDYYWEV